MACVAQFQLTTRSGTLRRHSYLRVVSAALPRRQDAARGRPEDRTGFATGRTGGTFMRRTRVAGLGLVIAVGALGWPALDSPAGAHPAAAKQAAGQQVAARGSGVTGGVPGLTADAVRTQVGVGADAQQRALTQYWTPQRMRLAISADQQPAVRTAAAKLRVTQARQAAAARTAARTGAGGAARRS